MNPEKKESILRSSEFFKELPGPQLRALAAIALSKTLKKGEFLFHEGDRGDAMFILAAGVVQVSKNSPDGKEIVIKLLQPFEAFGEVILFRRTDYPAQAVAIAPSEVLVLPRRQVDCLLLEPDFRAEFLAMLMAKLRYLTDRILFLTTSDVEERFFGFLLDNYGDALEMTVDIPKKDIASAIGTNPETLSRLISRLEREKRLVWEGKRITLYRP